MHKFIEKDHEKWNYETLGGMRTLKLSTFDKRWAASQTWFSNLGLPNQKRPYHSRIQAVFLTMSDCIVLNRLICLIKKYD